MLRYMLSFLLVNTYYCSLGSPIDAANHSPLPELLTALAHNCQNTFFTNHVKDKINDCNVVGSHYNEKQIECLIFYDINSRLCKLNITLTEEYKSKLNDHQELNSLCSIAKDWNFTNITDIPNYKAGAEKILKHPVTCGKVCGVEDVLSDEANFYCKYFLWGSELLQNQSNITQHDTQESPVVDKPQISSPISKNDAEEQKKKSTSDEPFKPIETSDDKTTPVKNQESSETVAKVSTSSKHPLGEALEDKIEDNDVDINRNNDSPVKPENSQGENKLSRIQNKSTTTTQRSTKKTASIKNQDDAQEPNDLDGEYDGNAHEPDPDHMEVVQERVESSGKTIKIISAYNGDLSGRDYANLEDDNNDHFFSFFLTAVILVVLLYVLYHNKNKVSKVILGLILEGRQSNRRRNSRGHAYRRLDTLEQAMSATTAAPPTKIIY